LLSFHFEENEVRTIITDRDGNPWFITKDVCEILGIKNSSIERFSLDDDEIQKMYIPSLSNNYTVISESGLYTLIIRSNKPQAKAFRRWVTHEVIPTIRKTGRYESTPSLSVPLRRPEYQDFDVFVAERFIADPAGLVSAKNIYTAYQAWCQYHQRPVYSHKLLGQYLKEVGYVRAKRAHGLYCWLGIQLRANTHLTEGLSNLQNALSKKEDEFLKEFLAIQIEMLTLLRSALEKSKDLD
jgi:hypothetical protein